MSHFKCLHQYILSDIDFCILKQIYWQYPPEEGVIDI